MHIQLLIVRRGEVQSRCPLEMVGGGGGGEFEADCESKRFSPYSFHLSMILFGSVSVAPWWSLIASCFGWKTLFFTVFIFSKSSFDWLFL